MTVLPNLPTNNGNYYVQSSYLMRGIDSVTKAYTYWVATSNDPTVVPTSTNPTLQGTLSSVQEVLQLLNAKPITVGGLIYQGFTRVDMTMPGSGSSDGIVGITRMGSWSYGKLVVQGFTTSASIVGDLLVFSGSAVYVT